MKKIYLTKLLLALSFVCLSHELEAFTEKLEEEGRVVCGVHEDHLLGFSNKEGDQWKGFNVDICRAVAAAIFNNKEQVAFVPLESQERFTALQSGKIDILTQTVTWTLTRDTALGVRFVGISYYDGQGFLVNSTLTVRSAFELKDKEGVIICVKENTTSEKNAENYFTKLKIQPKFIRVNSHAVALSFFEEGICNVITSDKSQLFSLRHTLNPRISRNSVILPESISKEPLGPVVRQGNDGWFNIVRWSLFAMIRAEELGINSKNIDEMLDSENPEIKYLLGSEGAAGRHLGLSKNWAYNIIKQVGNYGESFERNFSKLGIDRGYNKLWNKGGLQYSPPVR